MKARNYHQPPFKRLRTRAERLLGTSQAEMSKLPAHDLQKLVHELEVHQIELEMQNDELRLAQQELERARDRYADLYDFAPTAHLTLGADSEILEANLSAGKMLGLERSNLIHQKFTRFITEEAQDVCRPLYDQIFSSDTRRSLELKLVTAQRKRLVVQVEAVRDPANPRKQCRFSLTDITERKRSEELMQHEKQFSESIVTTAQAIILVLDTKGRIVRFNPYLEQISGHLSEELAGKDWFTSLLPKAEQKRLRRWFLKFIGGDQTYHNINPILTKDGKLRIIEWNNTPLRDELGHINGVLSVGQDITERQQAQKRIAQLDRMRAVLAGVDRAIVRTTDRQKLLDEICRVSVEKGGFNLAWIGLVAADGFVQPAAQAGATSYLKDIRVVTQDVPEGRGPVGTAIRENRTVLIENISRDSRKSPWLERARQFGMHYAASFPIRIAGVVAGAFSVYAPEADFFDENEMDLLTQVSEEISFALTALADLDARKKAEAALSRSEHNLSIFFNQAPIGLLWLSASGTILRANRAQLDMIGDAPENSLGCNFYDFYTEKDGGKDLLKRLAARENVRNQRMIMRSKNGGVHHVLVDANPIWSGDRLLYSSIFLRDITDRVQLEHEILHVSEREHRRISQDLHDGLGQLLVGAAYLASALRQDLAAKSLPEVRESGRVVEVINEAITQTRNLARGLHPVKPEPDGLMVALDVLAAWIRKLFHVRFRFHCPLPVMIHDEVVATHLFRIAQEAITNAIKHGKASRIIISLTETSGRVLLSIRNNGAGIPVRKLKNTGMGLRIMRYRAGMIGGSLTINPAADGGTSIVCSVQLPAKAHMNPRLPNAKKQPVKKTKD